MASKLAPTLAIAAGVATGAGVPALLGARGVGVAVGAVVGGLLGGAAASEIRDRDREARLAVMQVAHDAKVPYVPLKWSGFGAFPSPNPDGLPYVRVERDKAHTPRVRTQRDRSTTPSWFSSFFARLKPRRVAGSADPNPGRKPYFGSPVNPAVITGLIDLASTGAQVAGGIVLSREQRLQQQAALEAQARLEAARLQAQGAMVQSSSTAWAVGIGGAFAVAATAIIAWAFTRRRR